ncbi:MAG: VanZ family protein [Acetobacteraceae bacterium]
MRQQQDHAVGPASVWPSAGTAFGLSVLLAVVMTYSSTIISPIPMNYVPLDPAEALRTMLRLRFADTGSDQRADWIGNLLMLVPYGFTVTAMLWPRRTGWLKLPAFAVAMLLCFLTVVGIKYLQLFFPPRTVTLNYITAQSVGSLIGGVCFVLWHRWTAAPTLWRDRVAMLVLALRLYLLALVLFLLMPLDFALSLPDLIGQLLRLPDAITSVPGSGRPLPVRIVLQTASAASFVPVGMLLSLVWDGRYHVGRSVAAVFGLGLLLTSFIFALTTLVMGAAPGMIAITYRTFGIVIGGVLMHWLVRQDMDRLRRWLSALVPWMVLPYLAALILVNQLASTHWRSYEQIAPEVDLRGLLPLFDYYIVPKADAAKNIVGHVLMYIPIGITVWLRGPRRGRTVLAFLLGGLLSLGIEVARYFRPGLQGDINAVAVGAFAAALTVPAMDLAWSLLGDLVRQTANPRMRWEQRDATAVVLPGAGEVEHY